MENKTIRVGINGMGRIGRAFFRLAQNNPEIEVVAVNDLGDIDNIAYLMKYDTAYGPAQFQISVSQDKKKLITSSHSALATQDGKEIIFLSEKDPTNLPWGAMNVDIVIESTGAFTTYEKAKAHITAGAKRVIITAPVKDAPADETQATILMGINCDTLKEGKLTITSNASCTTNAGSPLIQILNEKIGIEKAVLNTVHGYTASQSIVDGPVKKPARPNESGHSGGDWKEGRAGAQNIIPTTTGAAIAVTKVIKELEGKFDGLSMRVPIVAGSIVDVTFISKRETSVEEVNQILKEAAASEHWQGIFAITEDPIVSSDVIGALYGSIADLGLTRVVGGNLVKVCAWYDNEMGYTATLIKHVLKMGQNIK